MADEQLNRLHAKINDYFDERPQRPIGTFLMQIINEEMGPLRMAAATLVKDARACFPEGLDSLGPLSALIVAIENALAGMPIPAGWTGKRVRVRPDWMRDWHDEDRDPSTILGTVLAEPVFVEQEWLPVKWDDREDPDFFKMAGLEVAEAAET